MYMTFLIYVCKEFFWRVYLTSFCMKVVRGKLKREISSKEFHGWISFVSKNKVKEFFFVVENFGGMSKKIETYIL